jgi:hypothetical protein
MRVYRKRKKRDLHRVSFLLTGGELDRFVKAGYASARDRL